MPTITLTRQQLYDRAWATPLDALAKELGLSGGGLGKLCDRHDIPVPPRGWWAKKAAGHRVRRPPLPAAAEAGTATTLRFNAPQGDETPTESGPDTHPLVVQERQPENRIEVADDLPLADLLVLKTERLLNKRQRVAGGLIPAPAGALHIHTSRALHVRALRILQALITGFEQRGFPVVGTAEGVRVTILDERLGFGVEEGLKKVPHAVSFTEQKLIDRGLGYQVPKFDQVPSGDLILVITNVHGLRQRWSEGAYKPAESLLNKFIAGLVKAAFGVKKQRADADRRERERQELERKRQEEARQQAETELRWREEQARVERLERLAAKWRRNRELRALLGELLAAVGEVDAASELGRWLVWAAEYADRSDPLVAFRNRDGKKLTVYYYGYDCQRVAVAGSRTSIATFRGFLGSFQDIRATLGS